MVKAEQQSGPARGRDRECVPQRVRAHIRWQPIGLFGRL
ncbi:Uncharacterised protein [Mycobacteroides abscessus subsp. abscessus]|nr:Uncharacterised protein [Mycobacteroides abscessus subsp. abscessus]